MTHARVPATESTITDRLNRLSLDQKIRVLTGSGAWTLHPIESVGLREIVVSDGPAGVRGVTGLSTETAACLPSPSAVSATWDRDLVRRVGELFAVEARRHHADVVLAPVVNLQRTPVGGRHFECFSEDPLLTGDLATTLVSTMQRHGVGACVKHFVANDSETSRTEYVARIDPRALREVYLAPFEAVVRDAGVWMVMAAYNSIDDGVETNSATEHRRLLHDLLKTEWGFDGVVVSDWTAATSTAATANAGLDLVMPGPGGPWEDALLKAVRRGEVGTATIDDKVRRILRLAHRTAALSGTNPSAAELPRVETEPLLRELAARATVVIKDTPRQLPHDPTALRSVALVGPNAVDAFLQGGGSAHVNPDHLVTPQQGLRAALPAGTTLTVHRGGYSRPHLPDLEPTRVRQPDGEPGVRIDYLDAAGSVIDSVGMTEWTGWIRTGIPAAADCARLTARIRLSEPGTHRLGVGTVGVHRVTVDGVETASGNVPAGGEVVLDSSVNAPPSHDSDVTIDEPRFVEVTADLQILDAEGWGRFVRAVLRHRLPGPDVDEEIEEAVAAARASDLAIVVVGTNNEVESEGWDRTDLSLPGRQDTLVRRIAAVAPRTVVVVNAGAPVLLPWLDEVDTVVWTWFPGQECGHALADVLFGVTEPSGRLPWTLPAAPADIPVPNAIPRDGVVDYTEGIHIGYRGYLRGGIPAAAPFGHGLGWTDWQYTSGEAALDDDNGATATVTVTNIGPRAGREVVQVYLSSDDTTVEHPVRWLAGFTTVDAEPGTTVTATITIPRRAFEVWDEASGTWRLPFARYTLHIGRSVTDIRTTVDLTR